jgi:Phytanoyl-CoA dioxygenase (PhyH)
MAAVYTAEQLTAFARDGYLVVPAVVDADRCVEAVARIDELLRDRPPAGGHTGHHHYFEPAEAEPLLMATLTESPAWQRAADLVAPLSLQARPQVQVALTFPPYHHRPGSGHIDGLTPPEPDGRPGSFTMLAGIVLSDQTRDDMGNLWVWPGTHRRLAEYLRSRGADAIMSFGGYPPVGPGEPVQVHAAPGDLVLASYLLAHNIGGNTSPVLRRTLYYRLSVAGHRDNWRAAVTDALEEFPAARAAAES